VVGAGPQGLAVAAYLRRAGFDTPVFGEVMGFWKNHMPQGMWLRSSKRSSSIAFPGRERTLAAHEEARGEPAPEPLPIERFVDYAEWYQRHEVPDVEPAHVRSVAQNGHGFRIETDSGDLHAERVVVAAGMKPFAWTPPEFAELGSELVSHPFDHTDLSVFSNRRVLVVGGGQSALESAALLHERGAEVEVVARAPGITWISAPAKHPTRKQRLTSHVWYPPTDVGSRGIAWIVAAPDVYRMLPGPLQRELHYDVIRPMGGFWLPGRMKDVPIQTSTRILGAKRSNGRVDVELDDGSRREVDHLLFATGYKVDVRRYDFLSHELVARLRLAGGYPVLRSGLESSVPGLHFVGAPAAHTFGPVMRFVTGSWYAAPALARHVLGKPPRPLNWSF
jgi:thioredoxin reductase